MEIGLKSKSSSSLVLDEVKAQVLSFPTLVLDWKLVNSYGKEAYFSPSLQYYVPQSMGGASIKGGACNRQNTVSNLRGCSPFVHH